MKKLTIAKPSNMHTHLRQNDGSNPLMPILAPLYADTSFHTVAMPNTTPPIATGRDAVNYKKIILDCTPWDLQQEFNPVVPLKILWGKDFQTTPRIIEEANYLGVICAKMYMRGVTTNSDDGVAIEDLTKLYPTFREMAKLNWVLQIHGEHPGKRVLAIDREFKFHPYFMEIHDEVPDLKIVFEHISDRRTIHLIKQMPENIAGTLSTHFMYQTLNDVVEPGLRPKNSYKPIAKRFEDCEAIVDAAISGNPKFFWGSDIAPHPIENKYKDCGACGCFPGEYDILWVLKKFHEMDALPQFENFVSVHGPWFYNLEIPKLKITFEECDPYLTDTMYHNIEIWNGGMEMNWRVRK